MAHNDPAVQVVDLADDVPIDDHTSAGNIVVAVGDLTAPNAGHWLDAATFTLTEDPVTDRRVVTVDSVDVAVADLVERIGGRPQAATVCADVLRAFDPGAPTLTGLITESLAYSTLQSGPEFARWLTERGPTHVRETADPVLVDRDGDTVRIRFNRPHRHNAFSTAARAALLDALRVVLLDTDVAAMTFSGVGPSFCSGGDLAEFGTLADPATGHLARTRHSPALALDAVTARLGRAAVARVHGKVLGSGLEMAAFCGSVVCDPDTVLGLPELGLGLLPGAGGTVSITRRIGRWRTAYLVLSGAMIDADTAWAWGLADEVAEIR